MYILYIFFSIIYRICLKVNIKATSYREKTSNHCHQCILVNLAVYGYMICNVYINILCVTICIQYFLSVRKCFHEKDSHIDQHG